MAASSPTGPSGSSSSSVLSHPSSTGSTLQFHMSMSSSISSEENSLDPKSRRPNSMNLIPRPPVRIVGFKIPELPSGRNPVPAILQRPGLCIRGPLGKPMSVEPIERLWPEHAKSLLTEALRPYSTPEPPCSGTLWSQYQGLQICRTWV